MERFDLKSFASNNSEHISKLINRYGSVFIVLVRDKSGEVFNAFCVSGDLVTPSYIKDSNSWNVELDGVYIYNLKMKGILSVDNKDVIRIILPNNNQEELIMERIDKFLKWNLGQSVPDKNSYGVKFN